MSNLTEKSFSGGIELLARREYAIRGLSQPACGPSDDASARPRSSDDNRFDLQRSEKDRLGSAARPAVNGDVASNGEAASRFLANALLPTP